MPLKSIESLNGKECAHSSATHTCAREPNHSFQDAVHYQCELYPRHRKDETRAFTFWTLSKQRSCCISSTLARADNGPLSTRFHFIRQDFLLHCRLGRDCLDEERTSWSHRLFLVYLIAWLMELRQETL